MVFQNITDGEPSGLSQDRERSEGSAVRWFLYIIHIRLLRWAPVLRYDRTAVFLGMGLGILVLAASLYLIHAGELIFPASLLWFVALIYLLKVTRRKGGRKE